MKGVAASIVLLSLCCHAMADEKACPVPGIMEPVGAVPELEYVCPCYKQNACCPEKSRKQIMDQAGPMGNLKFMFKSDKCVAKLRQLLCAQSCNPRQAEYITVGEPLTMNPNFRLFAGFNPGPDGTVDNVTVAVCNSFCDELYEACRDAELMGGQTVEAVYTRKELCVQLSVVEAAKMDFVKYVLSEQNCVAESIMKPCGPYMNFEIVADDSSKPCWAPSKDEESCGALELPKDPADAPADEEPTADYGEGSSAAELVRILGLPAMILAIFLSCY